MRGEKEENPRLWRAKMITGYDWERQEKTKVCGRDGGILKKNNKHQEKTKHNENLCRKDLTTKRLI